MSAALPDSLRRMAEQCGMDTVTALVNVFGGGHLCVPKTLSPGHRLLTALDPDAAQALVRCYGGETVIIPKGDHTRRAERNQAIRQDRAAGAKVLDIARRHGLTERRILDILKAAP